MTRFRLAWLALSLTAAMLAGAVQAFAKGEVTKSGFGVLTAGEESTFTTDGDCPDNGPEDLVSIAVIVKNQNGATVAGASASANGNGVAVSVIVPAQPAGTTLTATVTLVQTVGAGDTTKVVGKT